LPHAGAAAAAAAAGKLQRRHRTVVGGLGDDGTQVANGLAGQRKQRQHQEEYEELASACLKARHEVDNDREKQDLQESNAVIREVWSTQ